MREAIATQDIVEAADAEQMIVETADAEQASVKQADAASARPDQLSPRRGQPSSRRGQASTSAQGKAGHAEAVSPLVSLTAVSKVFDPAQGPVLDQVTLDVQPGEFVCLLGASGCGKSTLLNVLAGLTEATSGQVHTSSAALMFQESALLPWLTASRNIELALKLADSPRDFDVSRPSQAQAQPQQQVQRLAPAQAQGQDKGLIARLTDRLSQRWDQAAGRRDRAAQLLSLVRLDGVGDKRPHELSGGMRQRVALARALAQGRPLLLMDEPFAALDAITRDILHEELLRVWRETGQTIIFVTHNVREAARLGQRVLLMSSRPGRIVRQWHVTDHNRDNLPQQFTRYLRQEISRHAQ